MFSVLVIEPQAPQERNGVSRGLNESRFVWKGRIKAMGKTNQPLYERLEVVVRIKSIGPLVSESEIEAHPPCHHQQRKGLTRIIDLAGMCRGYIHHRGICAIGAKISLGADAVHEKTAALAGPGVHFCRT